MCVDSERSFRMKSIALTPGSLARSAVRSWWKTMSSPTPPFRKVFVDTDESGATTAVEYRVEFACGLCGNLWYEWVREPCDRLIDDPTRDVKCPECFREG